MSFVSFICSIRAQFASSDTRNACHGSDSQNSALREILILFPGSHHSFLALLLSLQFFLFVDIFILLYMEFLSLFAHNRCEFQQYISTIFTRVSLICVCALEWGFAALPTEQTVLVVKPDAQEKGECLTMKAMI